MTKLARLACGAAAGVLLVLEASAAVPALAAPVAKAEHQGSITGTLAAGKVVTVRVSVAHPTGWQKIQRVVVALRLRGRRLDEIVFRTSDLSIVVEGDGSPVVVGQAGHLEGPYFLVDASRVGLRAVGKGLTLSVPIRFQADPPPGARLFYSFVGFGLAPSGFTALSPPVEAGSGFSWGTLGVAVAVALFAGGFVGNLFASNRRRAQSGPSVYGIVQSRLQQEREKQ
jgi:hypothetical protein